LALTLCAGTAAAWDAIGHRAVTFLALDGLAADAPAFLRERERVHGVAWNGAEPDRWRNTKAPPYLAHVSNPDHYIDVEDLAEYGLTLSTIPPLRNRFVAVMAVQRHVHPGGGEGGSGGTMMRSHLTTRSSTRRASRSGRGFCRTRSWSGTRGL
jgi:hypothetical protein